MFQSFSDRIPELYPADLVITRAGAGSILRLFIVPPSILVPYPLLNNHQHGALFLKARRVLAIKRG